MKAKFILSFLLATTFVFGQQLKTTEKRVEIDLKDGRYNEHVYTMGNYGVVVMSFSKEGGVKTNINLYHDVYDTDLQLYETDPIEYDPYLPIMSTYETEDHIFHLAYRRKKRPISIYEFDVKNKTSKRLEMEYSGSEKFRGIEYFQVLGQQAAAIGFSKSGVHFLSFDLEKQTVTSTPIYIEDFKPGRIIATNMQYLEDAKKYYVSLRVYKTSKWHMHIC